MSRRPRRCHSPAFKAKVAIARSGVTKWKAQLEGGASDVFGDSTSAAPEPAVDVKALHAKIGQLTLESDFLEGALSKAGLLNAK
jgi:transposase